MGMLHLHSCIYNTALLLNLIVRETVIANIITLLYPAAAILIDIYIIFQNLTERCCSGKVVSILNSPFLSDSGIKCLALFRRLQKIKIEGIYW